MPHYRLLPNFELFSKKDKRISLKRIRNLEYCTKALLPNMTLLRIRKHTRCRCYENKLRITLYFAFRGRNNFNPVTANTFLCTLRVTSGYFFFLKRSRKVPWLEISWKFVRKSKQFSFKPFWKTISLFKKNYSHKIIFSIFSSIFVNIEQK